MTGLSVLHTRHATKEDGWNEIPDRDKVSRLREVYWAKSAVSYLGGKSFVKINLTMRTDRTNFGRKADHPGDEFIHLIEMFAESENRFEWIEVTEVYTTVPAMRIEDAMKAWNGIPNKRPVDFNEFRNSLNMGRPVRVEQRRASDETIRQIQRKLEKASYRELLEEYGYGTLVVGLPLWFATFPDDPWRVKNALDDFFTRTMLGVEDMEQKILRRRDCPFRQILVVWDTSPDALQEWDEKKSSEYLDAANTGIGNLIPGTKFVTVLSQTLNAKAPELGLEESEVPSLRLNIYVKTRKKKKGKGPYPEIVTQLGEITRKNKTFDITDRLKLRLALTLCQLLCFVRLYGFGGLERWIMRNMSVPHAWKLWTVRQSARNLYTESRRRSEDPCSGKG